MSKKREEVIKYLIDSKLGLTCINYQLKKQPQHYQNREDIIQDFYLWVLTYDEDKLWDAYSNNHLNSLITRYIQNQIFSKTSEYFRKYVKFNNLSNDLKDAERKESDI